MAAAKVKDFKKTNPALDYITAIEPDPDRRDTNEKAPEGYKENPRYIEKKTRRLQLVLQPSLYERVKKRAEKENVSVNEYIHKVLDEATREGKKQ